MLLSQTRCLDRIAAAKARCAWDRDAAAGATALAGGTLLVAGLGGIGSEVARRAKAFDMTGLATVRTARAAPEHVDELATGDRLDELLPRADVVVICLPLTPETEGLFDAARIARMKRGARLVNIARGRIVDTAALLAALESGHLAGACLDVTDPEPLPAEHPLWRRDDVVITPHVASQAEITEARAWALFVANAGRFARGEPLENVVDKSAGY
jgi:phosphoglycerate dehydrogenase-like enzyme